MLSKPENEKRDTAGSDRRRFPRGGRREGDRPGRHPKVAIIDAYEGVRRPCARYLEHFNFEIVEGAEAELGMQLLEAAPPALFLIEAPPSHALARLHEEATARSIPCISLMTALGESATPADGALVKPFTLGAMLDEIRRVLGARMRVGGESAAAAV